jgi:hypothetical protein
VLERLRQRGAFDRGVLGSDAVRKATRDVLDHVLRPFLGDGKLLTRRRRRHKHGEAQLGMTRTDT